MEIETKLCRVGRNPKAHSKTVNTPIYKTSTYVYSNIEEFLQDEKPYHTDIAYGRTGTPTAHALQLALQELEESRFSTLTSSGLSAIAMAILGNIKAGEHILIPDTAYKCTKRFAEEELSRLQIEYTYYDATLAEGIAEFIQPNTAILFMESPGSGTFEVQDIQTLCKTAKSQGIITIMDNSYATPVFCNPLKLGADISVMSLTKYISGHADLIMGYASCNDQTLHTNIHRAFLNYAPAPSPDDAFLALRGLRTLKSRLDHHQKSALEVARFLENHPKVEKVLHPGLQSHPQHNLWKKYFSGSAGVFSFKPIYHDTETLYNSINSLKFFGIGLSWGCFESLIVPYTLQPLPTIMRRHTEGFYLRLNIGLESTQDLIHDLDNALKLM